MSPDTDDLKSKDSNRDLLVIKDLSLFEEGYDEELDSFHHKAYAETIIKLIESNESPLSIGLFGSWGAGKSSILNIVKGEAKNKDFACVYFNAWKYAGDSFRRQFLLNAIEELFCEEDKKKALQEAKIHFHQEIPITDNRFKKIYSQIQKWRLGINLGTISFSLPTLNIDPKLVLPEQFEEEFKNILNPDKLRKKGYNGTAERINGKSFLFIIDDIDRCSPEMVITILNSVKTFLTLEKLRCFFVLALDDKAVITVLRKRNKSYSDEELLKFFDVIVRMNPLKKHDLVSFANIVEAQTKLPARVIQIAVYGGSDTPRKIKHFLNTFLVRVETAKRRVMEGFLIEMPDLNQLSKLLVIETRFPRIYKKILEDPNLIQRLQEYSEKYHSGKKKEIPEGFKNLSDPYEFMWVTRPITIDNPEMLIYLKLSQSANVLAKDGVKVGQLVSAIERFIPDELSELIRPIQSKESQNALVNFLREKLEPATGLFLENITASALHVSKNVKFEDYRRELCEAIAQSYIEERANIFNLPDVELLFECVNLLKLRRWRESLRNIGLTALDEVKKPQELKEKQPVNIAKFINYLYSNQLVKSETSARINKALKGWVESPEQLINVLENIEISENDLGDRIKKGNLIPDYDVINPLIDKIGIKEEEVSLYERTRKIVFKFWQHAYLEPIDGKLNSILADRAPQVTNLTPEIKFALETIIKLPACLDEKTALPIAQQIWDFYTKCPDPDGKILSSKAYLMSNYAIPDEAQKSSSRNQFLGQLHTLNPDQYKNILGFIRQYSKPDNWWIDLEKDFIVTMFNSVNGKLNDPSFAILRFEFVWKKGLGFLDMNQIENLFKNLTNHQTVNDDAFSQWRETILTFVPRVNRRRGGFLTEFCNDLYAQLTNLSIAPPISESRRREYLGVLAALTGKSGDKSLRINIGQKLISLLLNPDPSLRNMGIEFLSSTRQILGKDLRLYLSSTVKELCSKPLNEIPTFQQPILKTVDFQKEWDSEALNRFSDMVLTCLTNPDPGIQNAGYSFLEKASRVSRGKKKDITNAITNLCSMGLENEKRWEPILSGKKSILTRRLVDEYFRKARDEGE